MKLWGWRAVRASGILHECFPATSLSESRSLPPNPYPTPQVQLTRIPSLGGLSDSSVDWKQLLRVSRRVCICRVERGRVTTGAAAVAGRLESALMSPVGVSELREEELLPLPWPAEPIGVASSRSMAATGLRDRRACPADTPSNYPAAALLQDAYNSGGATPEEGSGSGRATPGGPPSPARVAPAAAPIGVAAAAEGVHLGSALLRMLSQASGGDPGRLSSLASMDWEGLLNDSVRAAVCVA